MTIANKIVFNLLWNIVFFGEILPNFDLKYDFDLYKGFSIEKMAQIH
jgi:hypothetical protein